MKKILISLLVLWAAVFTGSANAGPAFPSESVRGGGGVVFAGSDASVILGVRNFNKSLDTAQKQTEQNVNKIIRELISMGIQRTNIKTASYYISPQFDYYQDSAYKNMREKPLLTGYMVEHSILVENRDAYRIKNILEICLKNGASITSGQPVSSLPPAPVKSVINLINPTLIATDHTPVWMDKKGSIYGANDSAVYVSNDFWETRSRVGSPFNTAKYGKVQAVMVTDSGRIVATTDASGSSGVGHVFVSDADKTYFNSEPAFSFASGYTSREFGHSVHGDIVLLGSYGEFKAGKMPNEVYLSRDGGASWKRIFRGTPKGDAHVHDVCYDPYDNRIWVVFEDSGAPNRLFYSDDMGGAWAEVGDPNTGKSGVSVTQIMAFPHGVVFGSDGAPDGLYYWPRPKDKRQAPVLKNDIVRNFLLLGTEDQFVHIAHRSWITRDKGRQTALIPFTRESSKDSGNKASLRILASADGLKWHEIWQHPGHSGGRGNCIRTVIGPHPDDPDRTILAAVDIEHVTYYLKATLPHF